MKVWDDKGNCLEVPYDAKLLALKVNLVYIYNFLSTPDGSAWCTPERYGFEVVKDVHGLINYQRELSNGDYLVITDEDGSSLPLEGDEVGPTLFLCNDEWGGTKAEVDFAELPRNGRIDTSYATEELILQAAQLTDLDESCLVIQDAIGQAEGHWAGIYFSVMEQEDWPTFTNEERAEHLREYIALEKLMADK